MTDLNSVENLNTKPLSQEDLTSEIAPVTNDVAFVEQASDAQLTEAKGLEEKDVATESPEKVSETEVKDEKDPCVGYVTSTQDGTTVSVPQMISAHKRMGKNIPSDQE